MPQMNQKLFADVTGVDQGNWSRVLRGERDFEATTAVLVAGLTETHYTLWMKTPDASVEARQAAWERYKKKFNKEAA